MNQEISIFLFLIFIYYSSAFAESEVYHIETPGYGRYAINADPLDADNKESYIAKIPKVIRDGEILTITYDDKGEIKEEEFEVQNIISQGKSCRVHNKVVSEDGDFSGDVIYTEPCKVHE